MENPRGQISRVPWQNKALNQCDKKCLIYCLYLKTSLKFSGEIVYEHCQGIWSPSSSSPLLPTLLKHKRILLVEYHDSDYFQSPVQSVKPKERSRNRTRKLFWCPKLTQNWLNSGCRCCFSDIFHRSSKISGLKEEETCNQKSVGKRNVNSHYYATAQNSCERVGSKERQEEARGHCCVRSGRYFLI